MRSKVTVWREAMAVHDAGRKTRCGGLASRGKACGAGYVRETVTTRLYTPQHSVMTASWKEQEDTSRLQLWC